MHDLLLIARREYLERVRSRAFLVMTILFPLMISLLMGGSILASTDRAAVTASGASSGGLTTTGFPAISAGATARKVR